ncbi:MAG: hypothetical protein WC869_03285 [Phycisphaerae bacterium]|jgi:hypothetical protein
MKATTTFVVALAALALAAGTSLADTHTWNVASGNWNVSGNWNPANVPSGGDNAEIAKAGGACTVPSGYSTNSIYRVYVGQSTMPTLTVAGTLTVTNFMRVGDPKTSTASGKLVQTGTVNLGGNQLYIADGGSSSYSGVRGYYYLNSGTLTAGSIIMGDRNAGGYMYQSGGNVNASGSVEIGYTNYKTCEYNLTGGNLVCTGLNATCGTLQVGKDATCDVNGAMTVNANGVFKAEVANGDCTYVDVSGNVTLTGGCTLVVNLIGGYEPSNHQEFTIISCTGGGTISGNFTNLPMGWTTELRNSNTQLVAIYHTMLRAFPGAEGFGAFAAGGRGGDVYHVTNTNDSGAGSFRDGIASNRTIIFDVGGTITLASTLFIDPWGDGNLTIAGQTAPSDSGGICTKNYKIRPGAGIHDLVMRYLRIRIGTNAGQTDDSLDTACYNSIIDHCSVSWGKDECFSARGTNLTASWNIISEGINDAAHGYGSLIGPQTSGVRMSWHHNLYAHHLGRTPRAGAQNGANDFLMDYVNNVTYNWGTTQDWGCWGCVGAEYLNTNWVGNYAIAGSNTGAASYCNTVMNTSASGATCRVYHTGNYIDTDKDTSHDGVAVTNNNFKGGRTIVGSAFAIDSAYAVTASDANTAYQAVLAGVGATLPARDSRDTSVINSVTNRNGSIISSTPAFPSLATGTTPTDTDADGMPDSWENWYGTNPNTADNNGDLDSNDEYTNLERYLQYRVDPNSVTAGH